MVVVVIAMVLLQRRPAQDTQVHQEAEVEDSLVEVVVEATATVLLQPLQAILKSLNLKTSNGRKLLFYQDCKVLPFS